MVVIIFDLFFHLLVSDIASFRSVGKLFVIIRCDVHERIVTSRSDADFTVLVLGQIEMFERRVLMEFVLSVRFVDHVSGRPYNYDDEKHVGVALDKEQNDGKINYESHNSVEL